MEFFGISPLSKSRSNHLLRVMLVVLLLAAFMRIFTFRRFLPYTDYPDELNMYNLALNWRGTDLAKAYGTERIRNLLGGYPPLFVWVDMGVQQILESTLNRWIGAGEVSFWMRLIAVGLGLLSTAMILDTAWMLGGLLASIIAGLAWAIAPPIVEYGSMAIPDPFVYFGCTAALWFAIRAIRQNMPIYAVFSLIGAIIAIYAKYVPFYAVIPSGIALLVLSSRNWHRTLPYWISSGIVSAVSAGYLIYSVSQVPLNNSEGTMARVQGAERLLSLSRNWNNILTMIAPIGIVTTVLILTIGAVAWLTRRRRGERNLRPGWLLLLLLYLLPIVPVASVAKDTLGAGGPEMRHVMPGTIIALILLGLCLTETYLLVRNRFRWLTVLALVFIVGFWSTEALLADAQTIGRFSYPSTIYLLWRWSDVNIPPQGMILVSPQGGISDTWNRPWSGYNGTTSFQWWIADIQPQRTPDQYARDGIGYIALTNKDWAKWKDSTDFQQFTSRLFHVKTISSPAPTSEPNVDFYQVLPPQVQTNVVFGDQIALVGYDLPKQITSGAEVHLRLFWRALRHPDTNYSMFTHLYAQDPTKVLAQYDGAASTLDRLTLTWDDPDEVYINDSANLKLPDNLPSGDYHLSIGLYDFTNGKRLQIDPEKDAYIVLLHVSSN